MRVTIRLAPCRRSPFDVSLNSFQRCFKVISACRCSSPDEPPNIVDNPSCLCLTEGVDVYRSHGVVNRNTHPFCAEKQFRVRWCMKVRVRYGVSQLRREPQDKIREPPIIVSCAASYIQNIFTLHIYFWQLPSNITPPRLSRTRQNLVLTLNVEIGIVAVLLSRSQPLDKHIFSQLFAPMPCLFRRSRSCFADLA